MGNIFEYLIRVIKYVYFIVFVDCFFIMLFFSINSIIVRKIIFFI